MILTPGAHFPGRVFTFKPSRGKILVGDVQNRVAAPTTIPAPRIEDLLCEFAQQVLAALVRRYASSTHARTPCRRRCSRRRYGGRPRGYRTGRGRGY